MNTDGKYTASQVAKWFLYYNRIQMDNAGADYISNLKLQKLLYYAQGCYVALIGKPLFNDDIVAWEHGPVVPSVYQEYRGYHDRGIEYMDAFTEQFDPQTEDILEQVYDIFGQYSAWGLRNKTHEETPWKETPRNEVIKLDLIKDYFEKNYVS